MYKDFFHLSELPFSIVPNPKFYYLSEPHKEALMHVLNDIEEGGGLALLTGEVGTGKTTTLRELMARLPNNTQVITLLNPSVTVLELMTTLCKEMGLEYQPDDTFKTLYDVIACQLFSNEDKGIKTILLVDEAQHVSPDVLEQLRLLTNIENTQRKLLKVILIGQPELQQILRQPCLRQLAQRITARYHLIPLSTHEVKNYILHRLNVATRLEPLFSEAAINVIAIETAGVPRLINLVCDQALKMTYKESSQRVSRNVALTACRDVLDWQKSAQESKIKRFLPFFIVGGAAIFIVAVYFSWGTLGGDNKTLNVISDASLNSHASGVLSPSKTQGESEDMDEIRHLESKNIKVIAREDMIKEGQNFEEALQILYRQWGFQVNNLNCSKEVRGDLSCAKVAPTLSALLAMRRPAALTFKGSQNQTWYGVLLGENEDNFEIAVGNKRILMNRRFVERAWTGEAFVLWLPFLGDISPIKMGQEGARVVRLNDRLDIALGIPKSMISQFGFKLKQKVKGFQGLNGLAPDGIPGPLTFMMLDAVISMQGPRLKEDLLVSSEHIALLSKGDFVLLSENEPEDLTLVSLPKAMDEKVQTRKSIEMNKNIQTTKEDEFSLLGLDLSGISPQLLKRVQVAFSHEETETVEAKLASIETFVPGAQQNNAIQISTVSAQLLERLPSLDFQAHIYASSSLARWVKVNGMEVKEGGYISPGVRLRGIEPNEVVVEFEDILLAIPALTSW